MKTWEQTQISRRGFFRLFFTVPTHLFFFFGFAIFATTNARGLTGEELVLNSDWWPPFVSLAADFSVSGDRDIEIPAGTRGVMVRVEADEVILDFGRNGVHRVPIEQTDLVVQAAERKAQGTLDSALFADAMFNKFFLLKDGEAAQCSRADFGDSRYFLILYTRLASDRGDAVREAVEGLMSSSEVGSKDLSVVLVTFDESERELLDAAKAKQIHWPIMFHFLNRAYLNTLHHGASGDPTLALIDRNGRLLARLGSEASESQRRDFVTSLPETLRQDRLRVSASF